MSTKKILIVDDDSDIIVSMKKVLESANHKVETAKNENDCMDLFLKFKPDIIFMDMMMENMDSGFTLCRNIRDKDRKVIIYMLSSAADEKAGNFDMHEIGFNSSISKPLSPERLLEIVDEL